jgi:hypothetical protein
MSEKTPEKPRPTEPEQKRRKGEQHSDPPAAAGKVPPPEKREHSEGDRGLDGFK